MGYDDYYDEEYEPTQEEMEEMADLQIVDALHSLSTSEVGDVVTCPKGYAHALYNSSNSVGSFVFIKYN